MKRKIEHRPVSFWHYFRQTFARNHGIRIDHSLLSPQLAKKLVSCEIDKEPRGKEKPSDHAPIILELRWIESNAIGVLEVVRRPLASKEVLLKAYFGGCARF